MLESVRPYMTSAKFSDFLTPSPLVRKFTQPPLLGSLPSSAFPLTPPSPLGTDVINGSSPNRLHSIASLLHPTVEGVKVDWLVLGSLVGGIDQWGVSGTADDGVAVPEAPVDGQAGVAIGVGRVVEESGHERVRQG